MDIFVYKTLCETYENAYKQMIAAQTEQHDKNDLSVSNKPASREFKIALENLRAYLDTEGYKMPEPKWPYNTDDKSTWLYTIKGLNSGFRRLKINTNRGRRF